MNIAFATLLPLIILYLLAATFAPDLVIPWSVKLWMAEKLGFWKYTGLRGYQPTQWPHAYVEYSDGTRTSTMALGNAVDYARMFKGTVKRELRQV